MKILSFEEWLKKFKKEQSPIGDLARDFIGSGYSNIRQSFDKFTPCSDAIDAYKCARNAYIIQLAFQLHNELAPIISDNYSDDNEMFGSLETLSNLQDILQDIDKYLEDKEII